MTSTSLPVEDSLLARQFLSHDRQGRPCSLTVNASTRRSWPSKTRAPVHRLVSLLRLLKSRFGMPSSTRMSVLVSHVPYIRQAERSTRRTPRARFGLPASGRQRALVHASGPLGGEAFIRGVGPVSAARQRHELAPLGELGDRPIVCRHLRCAESEPDTRQFLALLQVELVGANLVSRAGLRIV